MFIYYYRPTWSISLQAVSPGQDVYLCLIEAMKEWITAHGVRLKEKATWCWWECSWLLQQTGIQLMVVFPTNEAVKRTTVNGTLNTIIYFSLILGFVAAKLSAFPLPREFVHLCSDWVAEVNSKVARDGCYTVCCLSEVTNAVCLCSAACFFPLSFSFLFIITVSYFLFLRQHSLLAVRSL